MVFFYAFFLKDAKSAHTCWSNIQKQAEQDADAATFRVKAALALLDGGDTEIVAGFVQKGLAKITDLPFDGQRKFEEKWLRAVLEAAEAGQKTEAV